MSKVKMLKKFLGASTFAGLGGYTGARIVSTPAYAKQNAEVGARTGVVTGAIAAGAAIAGKVVFRRIRGRIIPIRTK